MDLCHRRQACGEGPFGVALARETVDRTEESTCPDASPLPMSQRGDAIVVPHRFGYSEAGPAGLDAPPEQAAGRRCEPEGA